MTLADRLTGRRVYLDANIFIYALESLAPWDESSRMALDLSESGQCNAVTTELALAECLVKPLRLGNDMAVQTYLQAFQTRPGLHVLPVSRQVLIEAARVRATSGVKLPDAIHVATARLNGCDIILTNDARVHAAALPMDILLLSDMTP